VKRLSKWFYLGSIIGGQVGGIVLLVVAAVILVISGIFTDYIINLSYAGTWALATGIFIILNETIDGVNSVIALEAGTISKGGRLFGIVARRCGRAQHLLKAEPATVAIY